MQGGTPTAEAPNRTWVMDFTYVRTWAGFVYVAFVLDVFAQKIVAYTLNNRPRKVLGWKTPAEVFDEQLRSLQQPGVASTG